MKTLAKGIQKEKTSKQVFLTIVVFLFAIVAFGQDDGATENPFTHKKFITIRGDVNKSNPVEGVSLDQSNSGLGNQIETKLIPSRNNQVNIERSNDLPPYEQNPQTRCQLTSDNLRSYPNPFPAFTTIEYKVERPVYVHLAIYKKGMLVKILASDFHDASNYRVLFDARGLRAGTYIAVLTVGNQISTYTLYKVAEGK